MKIESNSHYKQQIEVTKETLKELGAENIPVIYAYNKTDLVEDKIPIVAEDCVYMSAKSRVGIDHLVNVIRRRAFTQYVRCEMLIPYDQGTIVSYLNDNATVKSVSYEGNGILMALECKEADFERYQQYIH